MNNYNFFFSGKNKIHVIMIACSFLFFSCDIINPAEPVPAYLHIDSVGFSSNHLTQGSSSHHITDAWVYVDGSLVGAFELPATFPVLSSGSHRLTVRPGILINGIASTRTAYPFYTGYDSILNFEPGKIIASMPSVTYVSSSSFSQIEDFDQTGISLLETSRSDTTINKVLDPFCYEGQSGKVFLDASHNFFECATIDSFLLLPGGYVYMELDYRANNEFTVGLITYTASRIFVDDIVTFKESDTWRKEYVNLGPYASSTSGVFGYKIFIKATRNSSLTNATLYFDNIKVVH